MLPTKFALNNCYFWYLIFPCIIWTCSYFLISFLKDILTRFSCPFSFLKGYIATQIMSQFHFQNWANGTVNALNLSFNVNTVYHQVLWKSLSVLTKLHLLSTESMIMFLITTTKWFYWLSTQYILYIDSNRYHFVFPGIDI